MSAKSIWAYRYHDAVADPEESSAFYGDFQALFDMDIVVEQGETIAVIGANGAGKTTFLRAVAGAITTVPGMVVFDGEPIGGRTPHEIVRLGIARCPRGAGCFPVSRSRKISCLAPIASVADRGISSGFTSVSPPFRFASFAIDGLVGRPAANDRRRPRPDVQSAIVVVR